MEYVPYVTVYTDLTASYTDFPRFWRGYGHGNHGSGSGCGLMLGEVAVDALKGHKPPAAELLTALEMALENPAPDLALGHAETGRGLIEGESIGLLAGLCHASYLLRFGVCDYHAHSA